MKKLFLIFCTIVLTLCVSACGDNKQAFDSADTDINSNEITVSNQTDKTESESIAIDTSRLLRVRDDISVHKEPELKSIYGKINIPVDIENIYSENIYVHSDCLGSLSNKPIEPGCSEGFGITLEPDDASLSLNNNGDYVWSAHFEIVNSDGTVLYEETLSTEIPASIVTTSKEMLEVGIVTTKKLDDVTLVDDGIVKVTMTDIEIDTDEKKNLSAKYRATNTSSDNRLYCKSWVYPDIESQDFAAGETVDVKPYESNYPQYIISFVVTEPELIGIGKGPEGNDYGYEATIYIITITTDGDTITYDVKNEKAQVYAYTQPW